MAKDSADLTLTSEDETRALGASLATVLNAGDTVLMTGDIGAGKTFLARALIQSLLLHPEDVPSPTFTLVQVYDTTLGEVWHCDLYRVGSTDEIEELGLIDTFGTALCLVEWPDRLGPLTPENALHIRLTLPARTEDDGARALHVSWVDPSWADRLGPIIDGANR